MTNAQKFQETFGIYATEMWAMPEHDFLKWLNADTSQTEETCERCVYVRGSQWCQGCNGTPKRWDGEKIVDAPQTESTGSPIGDYRDGVGAWQTERMTEEEFDTMLAKALVGQTDCGWGKPDED